MINSSYLHKISSAVKTVFLISMLFNFIGCVIESNGSKVSGLSGSTKTPDAIYPDPSFPLDGIFFQEGATQSLSGLTIPKNFTDSFLIRGKNLSKYLRTTPGTTQFCIASKYTHAPARDKFLILSAKQKTYTDLAKKTTEFYLQIEPNNDQANEADCGAYNFISSLFANAVNPESSFSLSQLCNDCTSAVTSSPLKLYFVTGEVVPSVNISFLSLTIAGGTGSSSNVCFESSACKINGYDCCLDSQCVRDRAIRPEAFTMPNFLSAKEDVDLNPERYVLYPHFYFVCPTSNGNPAGGGSTIDPNYQAAVRLSELAQLYQCLNKVDGEFSYCTVKFTEASKKIQAGTAFSPDSLEHVDKVRYTDDINFTVLNPNFFSDDYVNNIVRITHGGEVIYEANKISLGANGTFSGDNDNLSDAQNVTISRPLHPGAPDDTLYLTYKVDGTCEKAGTSLVKCSKSYVYNASLPIDPPAKTTTWHDASKDFILPDCADISLNSFSVVLKINGVVVPQDNATSWYPIPRDENISTSKNIIRFVNSYPLYKNQLIEITYYTKSGTASFISSRLKAQEKINLACNCGTSACNLKPVLDSSNAIVNYECVYPAPTSTTPPANQTVFVSNKNIPHRFFDQDGVAYDEEPLPDSPQELPLFNYTNNDVLKPNNTAATPIGFNEIYGPFAKSGTLSAKPAKMVKVKRNQSYDIFVNSGAFASCPTCGSDYYSLVQKIIPQVFTGPGGGYTPDIYESRREANVGPYRSDDLLFGRACFVPATMIPWTHVSAPSPRDQRRTRLAGQHFLFANGYQRDWYGFDYGSLIGSFDGVTWFSIGNQRRVKSTTGKLFLAVNSYYGDLNSENNYSVTVSETSSYSSEIPDHDTETSGAECQKSHFCSNDNDCHRQVGFDYTCQSVSAMTTNWPQFDSNASEINGSVSRYLVSLVGGTNGQSKRCVYRGRGAPCHSNLNSISTTFNGSSLVGTFACSSNNYCQSLSDGTSNRFNDRITRFANTPAAQNQAAVDPVLSDTVGLGARIIGRPYSYYGNKSISSLPAAGNSLSTNGVGAVCIPGKSINAASRTFDLNSLPPSNSIETSDKLFGVGPTLSGSQNLKYLNACPATDAAGYSIQQYDLPLGDPTTINILTTTQNLSSNLLDLTGLNSLIFSSSNNSQITKIGYQKNSCLRAPGASCFSDMECAPSGFIASKVRGINLSGFINSAEKEYWQEELTCGNPDFKYLNAGQVNPEYDLKKNVCCREFGRTISVYTEDSNSDYKWCNSSTNEIKVAGVNSNIASSDRYSRVHTGYDKMTCNRSEISNLKTFALSLTAPGPFERWLQVSQQYKTLDAINQRTCCTQNWVRSFASENGGGHAWSREKRQNIDKSIFKNINWSPNNTTLGDVDDPFECSIIDNHYMDSSCEVESITDFQADIYLKWFGSLELLGIPQVAIKANDQIYKKVDFEQESVGDPVSNLSDRRVIDNTIKPLTGTYAFTDSASPTPVTTVTEDFTDENNNKYYSAANLSNFEVGAGKLKKMFSESEFNCCLPSGTVVPDTTTASQCCTGFLATDTKRRCCLPDFTDVSLYLNRYVSSEGRGLPDSSYDPRTGFIKDPGQVKLLAAQKSLCCSGQVAIGVAYSTLSIPLTNGQYLQGQTSKRFVTRSDSVDNNAESTPSQVGSRYDAGLRWNNHVYCVPKGYNEN